MGWTLRSLLDEAGCEADTRGDGAIAGLAYDSRHVRAGDLFCCIPGSRADGHDHAEAAVADGASALLVERFLDVAVPQARVPTVRRVLGPLGDAFYGRPSRSMPVAGVTGTNGKTTVAYLLASIASAAGATPGLLGTVEYRVGDEVLPAARTTPESLDLQRMLARMRDGGAAMVAMEVTSEGIDAGRVDGMWFACTGFTNLSQDHLNHHGTMERYFEAKARIFDPVHTTTAVINASDAYGARLIEDCRRRGLTVLTYGAPGADLVCEAVALGVDETRATLLTPSGRVEVRTSLVGHYNVDNVLCAVGLAVVLGYGTDAVAAGVDALRAVPGRLERVEAGQPFTVLVDYAHSPDALERALSASRELTSGRLIVVFGCGGDRDRAKRPLMGQAAGRIADLTIVTSDNPRSEDPLAIIDEILAGVGDAAGEHRTIPDRREAIAAALSAAGPGDLVLVAGKGHESGQTFADHTVPFDDREVVRELLGGEIPCHR